MTQEEDRVSLSGEGPPPEASGTRDVPELVPVRMLNEFAYCPRLFYLEWVQGEWADNVFTVDGRERHRRVDRRDEALPVPDEARPFEARSVALSSPTLGLSTKVDVIEGAEGEVVPVDYKRGEPPEAAPGGVWEPERVQLCAQGLILREHGYRCDRGAIYFAGSKQRIEVPFTEALVARTRELVRALRATAAGTIPPPLVNNPKCDNCSLQAICLPDEVNRLARIGAAAARAADQPPAEGGGEDVGDPLRRVFAARDEALPLYVQRSGLSLGLDGEVIQVREPGKGGSVIQEARLLQTSQVCLFGNVNVSPALIRELCDREIPLLFLSHAGWYYGRIEGLGHKNAELRIAQFAAAADPTRRLAIARGFVRSKALNARTLLRRNHTEPAPGAVLLELATMAERAIEAPSIETLLGIEGNAARAYFGAFTGMLRPPAPGSGGSGEGGEGGERAWRFELAGRNRRPPRDPVNAMLSFMYALLTKDWHIAVAACGFDPYVGFYHRPRYGRPALALDLMEEFRPLIADSAVLQAVNQGVVAVDDFIVGGGGVALKAEGRRRLLQAYERRMDQLVTHSVFGYRLSYRRVLELQARLLGRYLLGEIGAYPEFRTR